MHKDYLGYCRANNTKPISQVNYNFLLDCVGPEQNSLLASLDSVYVRCGRQNFEDFILLVDKICDGQASNVRMKDPLLLLIDKVEKHIRS